MGKFSSRKKYPWIRKHDDVSGAPKSRDLQWKVKALDNVMEQGQNEFFFLQEGEKEFDRKKMFSLILI